MLSAIIDLPMYYMSQSLELSFLVHSILHSSSDAWGGRQAGRFWVCEADTNAHDTRAAEAAEKWRTRQGWVREQHPRAAAEGDGRGDECDPRIRPLDGAGDGQASRARNGGGRLECRLHCHRDAHWQTAMASLFEQPRRAIPHCNLKLSPTFATTTFPQRKSISVRVLPP
jgi:hypothetical protein